MRDRVIDLEDEMMAYASASGKHLARLLHAGIPAETIAYLGSFAPLGVSRVREGKDGLFEPSADGDLRIIVPVLENGGVVDLIAVNPAQPGRWSWRIGQGWALGVDELLRPRFDDGPADVLPTPIAWLRDGAKATVILDFDSPELVPALITCNSIQTDNKTARLIRLAFAKPRPLPEIIVARGARYAA
jgi:hypothetical protein